MAASDYVTKTILDQRAKALNQPTEEERKQMRQAALFEAQERRLQNQYRAARDADLARGKQRGEQIFGNQALGRIDDARSKEIQDILSARKSNLSGFSTEEQQAMRDQNLAAILQGQKAGARDLARQQARAGVRGSIAGAQQQALQTATQGQLADQERQLFLNQIAERRSALDKFEGSQTAAEQSELGRKQFNLSQANKELLGKLSTEMGYGGLGAAERASAVQSVVGDKQLAAAKEAAAAGGKK